MCYSVRTGNLLLIADWNNHATDHSHPYGFTSVPVAFFGSSMYFASNSKLSESILLSYTDIVLLSIARQ